MGIVSKTIRYSLPIGFTYYSVQLGAWMPGAGDPTAERRLACQKRLIEKETEWLGQQVNGFVPHYELQMPDFASTWNCWVKCAMRSVINFDGRAAATKLMEKISASIDGTKEKATSNGDEKSSASGKSLPSRGS